MKVSIVNITSNPIETIYKAYRVCYSRLPYEEVPTKSEEEMIEFIEPLMADNHTSPLEHVNITFNVSGISRACLAQLTRHRTMSFNVKSQRYVNEKSFDYVIPQAIKNDKNALYLFESHMRDIADLYKSFKELGINNEDARSILPNAATTNLVVTVDLNNFRKFLSLRLCKHAQAEIRSLATQMLLQVQQYIPFAGYKVMNCGNCGECKNG